jgi:hypothetical protein
VLSYNEVRGVKAGTTWRSGCCSIRRVASCPFLLCQQLRHLLLTAHMHVLAVSSSHQCVRCVPHACRFLWPPLCCGCCLPACLPACLPVCLAVSCQSKRLHHVLYLDGEEEWLDLSNEVVVWARATRGGAVSAGHFLSSECDPTWTVFCGWSVFEKQECTPKQERHTVTAGSCAGRVDWHLSKGRAAVTNTPAHCVCV